MSLRFCPPRVFLLVVLYDQPLAVDDAFTILDLSRSATIYISSTVPRDVRDAKGIEKKRKEKRRVEGCLRLSEYSILLFFVSPLCVL